MDGPPGIFLDLDDTIVRFDVVADASWRVAISRHADRLGGLSPEECFHALRTSAREFCSDPKRHRRGRMDLGRARRLIVAAGLKRHGLHDPVLVERLALDYDEIRSEAVDVFPGALEAIQDWRAEGIRLALITNGMEATQRAKIDRFGLASYVDLILIEGDYRVGKPDRRVYEHVLDRLHLEAAEALMVGDNWEWDVAGAWAVGIRRSGSIAGADRARMAGSCPGPDHPDTRGPASAVDRSVARPEARRGKGRDSPASLAFCWEKEPVVDTMATWDPILKAAIPGARLTSVTVIPDGTTNDVVRLTYQTRTGDPGAVIARKRRGADPGVQNGLSRGAYEYHLLQLLLKEGLPVPRPVALLPATDPDSSPILLIEFVEGVTGRAEGNLPDAVLEAARSLARIHEVDVSDEAYTFLAPVTFPVTMPALARNAPVLVHGDFWPGNLVFEGTQIRAILDWEDAGIGSPLIDLANTRFELWLADGERAADQFTAAYIGARPDVNLEYLPRFELHIAAKARPLLACWTDDPVRLARMRDTLEAFEDTAGRRA